MYDLRSLKTFFFSSCTDWGVQGDTQVTKALNSNIDHVFLLDRYTIRTRVMKTLESLRILQICFQGLENHGVLIWVLENENYCIKSF